MSAIFLGEAVVPLQEVLQAREDRAAKQRTLLDRFGRPLISFTMNIAGPIKDTPLIRFAFRAGLCRLRGALGEPVHGETAFPRAGPAALLVYDRPAAELKALCLAIEEEREIGRLYDMDVLDTDGKKLSRPQERTCLLCGGPAGPCARSRAHGLPSLEERTIELLRAFAGDHLGHLAAEALLQEAAFTPKPGLVDGRNSGAHQDMDLPLFQRSAEALRPHLRQFAALGLAGASPKKLQRAGQAAEADMFAATGGVNTHKGAVYSLSLLLWAAGASFFRKLPVLSVAATAAKALPPAKGTHGSAVRARYGLRGVRGEAVAGFPTLRQCCAVLEREGLLTALVWSMAHLEDTNLYHRGGEAGAAYVRGEAAKILTAPPEAREALARSLDDELIRRNLSPGGSADLLALALFLQELKERMEPGTLF